MSKDAPQDPLDGESEDQTIPELEQPAKEQQSESSSKKLLVTDDEVKGGGFLDKFLNANRSRRDFNTWAARIIFFVTLGAAN